MKKDRVVQIIKDNYMGLIITVVSILIILLLDFLGLFYQLELKTVDSRFKLRGPLTGWSSRKPIPQDSLNVVLVDLDDESWRLIPWSWPYPRGDFWGRVVENLSKAGAKVIVFDIEFDSPDTRSSEYLQFFKKQIDALGVKGIIPEHGDVVLARKIVEARRRGTEVVLAAKLVQEPTRVPPQYIQLPVEDILKSNPETGLINEIQDLDGFTRKYALFWSMQHEPEKAYLELGIKAIKEYLSIPDTTLPRIDLGEKVMRYGPLNIKIYDRSQFMLINYYGPPSGVKIGDLDAWKTFPRYPLSMVIDTKDIDLRDYEEDTDWMGNFIGSGLPDWVEAIEDSATRAEMAAMFGGNQNPESSPFYNKIVLIGSSTEIQHDTKHTPFYTYAGVPQLMPGVEMHANAIQTILDGNFISVFGSSLELNSDSFPGQFFIIALLALIAFLFLSLTNPIIGAAVMIIEIGVYLSLAVGSFTRDYLWLVKRFFQLVLPDSWLVGMGSGVIINVPGMGESVLYPVVAPIAGIILTYGSNVIYKFLMEQRDKRFLKNTFGTYISPELIDQMYKEKQQPKLGGDSGLKTAYFTDIQSFSSFSEVLSATQLVELLNEYLTVMTDILLAHNGTLDKYEGDAIVAFFGAPIPMEDHAKQACLVALKMQEELAKLREKWRVEGDKWPDLIHEMRMRIGINSGDIVTGNMGSSMRMNYTMMGDAVNTAARLEASAKQYGIYIQITKQTLSLAGMNEFEYREIDKVRVVGKKEPVETFELLALAGSLNGDLATMREIYNDGLKLYRNQEWEKAIARFKESDRLEEKFPNRPTNPSRVYLERCKYYMANPPGDDWDGVWVLTQK